MNKLKIPENHSGVSKTLRLPENIVEDVQNLADLKNLSFNKTIISLLEFIVCQPVEANAHSFKCTLIFFKD